MAIGLKKAIVYLQIGRFRCQECGRLIPKGRNTCPKCGSTDIDLA